MDSILLSIKKLLGIEANYDAFDTDIIMFINSSLSNLRQIGVGPKDGFFITGVNETWNEFIGDAKNLENVKQYVYLETKIIFDPSASSFVLDALKEQKKELAWRIQLTTEENEVNQNG